MGNSCKETTDDIPRLAKYDKPQAAATVDPDHNAFSVKQLNEYYSNNNSKATVEST